MKTLLAVLFTLVFAGQVLASDGAEHTGHQHRAVVEHSRQMLASDGADHVGAHRRV